MSPAQSKAARAVLRWTVADLASRSRITLDQLRQWEDGGHMNPPVLEQLRACFEAAGVEIARDGYAIGWRSIGDEVDGAHERGGPRPRFLTVGTIE